MLSRRLALLQALAVQHLERAERVLGPLLAWLRAGEQDTPLAGELLQMAIRHCEAPPGEA